jgi:hypothetical protein
MLHVVRGAVTTTHGRQLSAAAAAIVKLSASRPISSGLATLRPLLRLQVRAPAATRLRLCSER